MRSLKRLHPPILRFGPNAFIASRTSPYGLTKLLNQHSRANGGPVIGVGVDIGSGPDIGVAWMIDAQHPGVESFRFSLPLDDDPPVSSRF